MIKWTIEVNLREDSEKAEQETLRLLLDFRDAEVAKGRSLTTKEAISEFFETHSEVQTPPRTMEIIYDDGEFTTVADAEARKVLSGMPFSQVVFSGWRNAKTPGEMQYALERLSSGSTGNPFGGLGRVTCSEVIEPVVPPKSNIDLLPDARI
jgi:hypothetical protein